MSNSTQTFKLYEVLKGGEPVTVEKIAQELSIKILSVPVYIHGLKKMKANIVAIREGRKVVSYKLTNAADVKVMEFRKNSATVPTKAAIKPALDKIADDLDTANNDTYSDKTLADMALSVGADVPKGALAD
jgi:predicted transcriptional regulator